MSAHYCHYRVEALPGQCIETVRPVRSIGLRRLGRLLAATVSLILVCISGLVARTQESNSTKPIPVLTGGSGFITTFDGGDAHLGPIVAPVLLVPFGDRWLVESRASFEADLARLPGSNAFRGSVAKQVDYLQLNYIASPFLTITAGRFLTPFGTFNERLYPVWIRNLQADPLILPIGIGPSNAGTGGMVRGGFPVGPEVTLNYAAYFSAASTVDRFTSNRSAGGRFGFFLPKARLEMGASFQHLLQDERSNAFGFHFVWQPPPVPVDVRAEYARSSRGSGYWIESAYRLAQFPVWRNALRHTQVVGRVQQFFVGTQADDSLPGVNTTQVEGGLNYYFLDGLRAAASYGRQFTAAENKNVWTVGITYRFAFPLGPGGGK
jgi:hypothetical protein